MNRTARVIALHLPQYHPIPENDEWWGKGFTEWTNTAKARPLYSGHYQPHVPADLGFYDLRLPEAREAQAELAALYGIEAFCYYHYWFGGRRILERPLNEIISTGRPDFPFCLCWANETWSGVWHGTPKRTLIEQTYPGKDDYEQHFFELLKAFTDRRYVTVNGKPLFLIYKPWDIPDIREAVDLWREMAERAGLKGLHIVGMQAPPDYGGCFDAFDAFVVCRLPLRKRWVKRDKNYGKWLINGVMTKISEKNGKPTVYSYDKDLPELYSDDRLTEKIYPCIIPNWDNTPRCQAEGFVLHGSTPELFRKQVRKALHMINSYTYERSLIFVKSWNEWAEGNHLEPDLKFGRGYLEVLRDEITLRDQCHGGLNCEDT